MATIREVLNWMESLAPRSMQESYDNSGLLVGDDTQPVKGVLVSLDCTEEIVDEAVRKGCNLIVSHHPIVFGGLKKITGSNYVERTVIKAIQNGIALYAIHTNLDNYRFGVNEEIGRRLGLVNLKILAPAKGKLLKLMVFVPKTHATDLANALFQAGAGHIGEYDQCSFATQGIGTFRPSSAANPFIGEAGKREEVEELKVETILPAYKLPTVLTAMKQAHPYEEVAYDVVALENENQYEGSGMVGELETEMDLMDFLNQVKETFSCGVIRYTQPVKRQIKRVAFCGGSGSFLLAHAKREKADVFITGDYKYHDFFDAENQLVIADVGHYESEQFTIDLIGRILKEKFTTFAVHLTEINTNPIKYL